MVRWMQRFEPNRYSGALDFTCRAPPVIMVM